MSSNQNKGKGKDKGKGIQKAEDYQLEVPLKIPTHYQFQTLTNFPPFFHTKPWYPNQLSNQPLTMHTTFDILNIFSSLVTKPSHLQTFSNHLFKEPLAKNIFLLMTHKKPNNSTNLSLSLIHI